MTPHTLLLALLVIFPHFPMRPCIERRVNEIESSLARAETEYGVPAGILLSVGFHETHAGCDRNEGGGWGAPVDNQHRHTAGTSDHAARALARSYTVCGTWLGAVNRFRCGLCQCRGSQAHYPPSVRRLTCRLYGFDAERCRVLFGR